MIDCQSIITNVFQSELGNAFLQLTRLRSQPFDFSAVGLADNVSGEPLLTVQGPSSALARRAFHP